MKYLTIVCLSLVFLLLVDASSAQEFHCWLEAELPTSRTLGFAAVKVNQTEALDRQAQYFLERSGWKGESINKASGDACIVMMNGARGYPTLDDRAIYSFSVPKAGRYYVWIRCNSPPPCNRYMNIWFDCEENRSEPRPLIFAHAGVWTWWPWRTAKENSGIFLEAGLHRLFLGDVNGGLMVDKFLITDNADYIPFGASEANYNATFEPPIIADSHGLFVREKARTEPLANGWRPCPAHLWSIKEDSLTGEHRYHLDAKSSKNIDGLKYALIEGLDLNFFHASFDMLVDAETCNGYFLYSYTDVENYSFVKFDAGAVSINKCENGRPAVIGSNNFTFAPGKLYEVEATRFRDLLRINCNGKLTLSVRMPVGASGSFGVGSSTGGVSFDNVIIQPLDIPDATFNFADHADPSLRDWASFQNGKISSWSPEKRLLKDELVVYRAPFWHDSEAVIDFSMVQGALSVFFPFVDAGHCIETHFNPKGADELEISIIRHVNGERGTLTKKTIRPEEFPESKYSIQMVRGELALFNGNQRLVEVNVPELITGTIAFGGCVDIPLPVKSIQIRRKNMIVDSFPLTQSSEIADFWETRLGRWTVKDSIGATEEDFRDGQLIASGIGRLDIGSSLWEDYICDVSALFEENTHIGLIGWNQNDESFDLLCDSGKMTIERTVNGKSMVLVSRVLDSKLSGWHKIEASFTDGKITGSIDDITIVSWNTEGRSGKAGIRNLSDYAIFDDFRVCILKESEPQPDLVQNVNTTFFDIESSLLDGQ